MILLVVDMQKGIVDEDLYAYDTFMDRTARLIDAARKNHVEVIYVQHDGGPGSGIRPQSGAGAGVSDGPLRAPPAGLRPCGRGAGKGPDAGAGGGHPGVHPADEGGGRPWLTSQRRR